MTKQKILVLNQKTPKVLKIIHFGESVYVSIILIAITFKYIYVNANTNFYNVIFKTISYLMHNLILYIKMFIDAINHAENFMHST